MKMVLLHYLKHLGGSFLLDCNFSTAFLSSLLSFFYKECFSAWVSLKTNKDNESRFHFQPSYMEPGTHTHYLERDCKVHPAINTVTKVSIFGSRFPVKSSYHDDCHKSDRYDTLCLFRGNRKSKNIHFCDCADGQTQYGRITLLV